MFSRTEARDTSSVSKNAFEVIAEDLLRHLWLDTQFIENCSLRPVNDSTPAAREKGRVRAEDQPVRSRYEKRSVEDLGQGEPRYELDPAVRARRVEMDARAGLGGHQRFSEEAAAEVRHDHRYVRETDRRRCEREGVAEPQVEHARQPHSGACLD